MAAAIFPNMKRVEKAIIKRTENPEIHDTDDNDRMQIVAPFLLT